MVSSNYAERRLIQGLFLHKRKQLPKKRKTTTKTKTIRQTIKQNAGEVKRQPTINSNLRRTVVKRRLHEAEAFQS